MTGFTASKYYRQCLIKNRAQNNQGFPYMQRVSVILFIEYFLIREAKGMYGVLRKP